jgi:uncharacterized protein (DUF58 family)
MDTASAPAEVVLGRRQLFMLPTRHGLVFLLVLMTLLLAAINYENGLAYGFTFLLAGVAVVSMLHTHRNLYRLRLTPGSCASVFAGQAATFPVCLTNDSDNLRFGVCLEHARREIARADLAQDETACLPLTVPTECRGYLRAPPFSVSTRFPLGLLYSWSQRVALEQQCLVYPSPAPPEPMRPSAHGLGEAGGNRSHEGDDFVGLREYRPGDSMRHVDWKAVARGQGWHTKQFGQGGKSRVWLDWDTLDGLDTETRLSVLCRWVLDAEHGQMEYGLRLPGTVVNPGSGVEHQHRCLEALALFPEGQRA